MIVLLLLAFGAQPTFRSQPLVRGDVPALAVVRVEPREGGQCLVVLRNVHSRPAVAWFVMESDGGGGTSTDQLLIPALRFMAGAEREEVIPCRPNKADELVAGALYDDDTVGGDIATVDRQIVAVRHRHAKSLRDLVSVLEVARIRSSSQADRIAELSELIASSDGGAINALARARASAALSRMARTQEGGLPNNDERSALLRSLSQMIAALEAMQPSAGGM